ncbi:MAG: DUF4301 family protein [Gilvibacter sp.]
MEFNQEDVSQIEALGLSVQQVLGQLEMFKRGFPPTRLATSAIIGNGIEDLNEAKRKSLVDYFDSQKDQKDLVKFTPASGAATRMFKNLYQFLNHYDSERESLKEFIQRNRLNGLEAFLHGVSHFAFINPLRKEIRARYPDYKFKSKGERCMILVRTLLSDQGLNYGSMPKGLIPFHKYTKYATTAFEEQLYEGTTYAASNDAIFAHFTFSPEHVEAFKKEFEAVKSRVEKKTRKEVHVSYSFQESNTNTIAVDMNNEPFRDANERLIFRPAGHGALLENLNEVNADVIFIKNIDNVIAEEYVDTIALYKKVLAGKLLSLQDKIFGFLHQLREDDPSEDLISEVRSFMWNELYIKDVSDSPLQLAALLNRPVRVCGMVKNTGAIGGGPFWVIDSDGVQSLQIVEAAQIDNKDASQRSILHESTHFNPVDVVCGVRDYLGDKFDLTSFTDPNTGFISIKDIDGTPIKALELPGLWNGGMANWNTVFIEVPLITFNPVKTVNDLLNKEHQPNL